MRYCSTSSGEPTTPNVSVVGGSSGADEVALDEGSVGDELGLDDAEDDGEPQPDADHDEARWLTLDELDEVGWLPIDRDLLPLIAPLLQRAGKP